MSLVLHLHWRSPAQAEEEPIFLLWAETSEGASPGQIHQGATPELVARQHPFAESNDAILRRLAQSYDAELISQGTATLTFWLPSTRSGPLPSPELVHNWELDLDDPQLQPWLITGLRLPLASGLRLLARFTTHPSNVLLGSDIRYWARALIFTNELLVRQHYVPAITPASRPNVYCAHWQPVLDAPNVAPRLKTIAAAMPPLCRSAVAQPELAPSPHDLLSAFLERSCDHLVRTQAAGAPHHIAYLHEENATVAWLKTLVQPDCTLAGPTGQIITLCEEVKNWQRNLAPTGDTQFAIALQLVAPAPSGATRFHVPEHGWRLDYLLQARDDEDIVIPASEVWSSHSDSLVYENHRFDRPQEKLLQGLGQAGRVFPPIERSLKSPTPTSVELDTQEVYHFLRDATPLLRQSGFVLRLPSWWEAAGATLALRLILTPSEPAPPDVIRQPGSGDAPIRFRWELVLGDTVLTRTTFASLVALRSPLVQYRDQWLRVEPEQIEAAGQFLAQGVFSGRMDLKTAVREIQGFDNQTRISGLPVHEVIAEGWLPEIIQQLTLADLSLRTEPQPSDLQGQLRPYQRHGSAWLHRHLHLGLGACLADDMGLGKSVQAIAVLLKELAEQSRLPGPTLIVCPTTLLGNWWREFKRFAPALRVFIYHGAERPRNGEFATTVGAYDVILTSYTLARRDADFFQRVDWFGVILDEAQKIKNPDAQVTQAINTFRSTFRFALTGTPMENRLSELWSIMNFLDAGYLGNPSNFRTNYVLPIENYQDMVSTARLQRIVRPFLLRRVKSDPTVIQDLPERLEMKTYCTVTDEQAGLYQKIVEESLPRIADSRGGARRIHVFNLLTKLKQILNHPVLFHETIDERHLPSDPLGGRSGKLDRLIEMLEEVLATGDKALVFTQFAQMGHLLVAHIQQQFDRPVFYLHGGVPARQRSQIVARFQEDPHAAPIFVLTLGTGGLGLNLTAAAHVFHFDRWWNPAVENQASDRAYRIGQTRNVQIHKFITAGTIEESIDEMIERKHGLAESIIGADESWIGNLSDAELIEMVMLRQDRN